MLCRSSQSTSRQSRWSLQRTWVGSLLETNIGDRLPGFQSAKSRLSQPINAVVDADVAVSLEVVDRGAEVARVVDGEVDAQARLWTGAGRGEADLVAFVENDDALLLFGSFGHPVVVAVGTADPLERHA